MGEAYVRFALEHRPLEHRDDDPGEQHQANLRGSLKGKIPVQLGDEGTGNDRMRAMMQDAKDFLRISKCPSFDQATLVLAFSGWMDGGDVSTGTVRGLIELLGARAVADIDPDPFCIYSFPGSMEPTSLVFTDANATALTVSNGAGGARRTIVTATGRHIIVRLGLTRDGSRVVYTLV